MTDTAAPATDPTRQPKFADVQLEEPFVRGGKSWDVIQVRRPSAGELRGVELASLYRMDVLSVARVIGRITDPMISEKEYLALPAMDAASLASQVSDFLLPKSMKDEAGLDA